MITRENRQNDYSVSKLKLRFVKFHPYDLESGVSLKEPLYDQLLQGICIAAGNGDGPNLSPEHTEDGNLRIFIKERIKGKYEYFLEFKGSKPIGEAICGRRVYEKGSKDDWHGDDFFNVDHKGRSLHYPDTDFLWGMNEAYLSIANLPKRPSMLSNALRNIKNSFR